MRKLYDRLLKSLNINGRDFAVLLLALLLAFSIWLLHNLSLKYNDYLSVSVVAHCNIEGHADVSSNRCEVMARCRATGYNVISSMIKGKHDVIDVDFKPAVMKHKDGETFYVSASDLQDYAHVFFGADVSVDYFVTDTLFFRFPYQDHKKVPVHPVFSVTYSEQYMSSGDLEIEPDSVTLYGEPYRLETIDKVYTSPIRYADLSEDVQGVVRIEKVKGLRMSEDDVHYSLDVTRYVEVNTSVPVQTNGLPVGKEMLILPSSVDVTLKCVFPLMADPLAGLSFAVDYDSFINSLSGRCEVKPVSLPKGVIGYEVHPPVIGCFIKD